MRTYQLRIRRRRRFADDVAIELVKLPQAAALLFFVTKKLWHAEPFHRLFEIALSRRHHAGERWRHLRSKRAFDDAGVSGSPHEIEKLADELAAGFFLVERHRFERRAVVLDEAVAARDFTPLGEDIVPPRTIVGIKVAEAG